MIREAGYDGEYGVIRLFEEGELKRLTSGGLLFDAPVVQAEEAVAASRRRDMQVCRIEGHARALYPLSSCTGR